MCVHGEGPQDTDSIDRHLFKPHHEHNESTRFYSCICIVLGQRAVSWLGVKVQSSVLRELFTISSTAIKMGVVTSTAVRWASRGQ